MARQRRTLDEQIADLVTRGRSERYSVLSTPAMAGIGPEMIEDGAIKWDSLDEEITQNLDGMGELLDTAKRDVDDLNSSLAEARREVTDLDDRLADAALDLAHQSKRIDDEILPAINDAAASPITDARLKAGSITVWPFTPGAIPQGTIGAHEISDFSLVARKFKDDRHRLY